MSTVIGKELLETVSDNFANFTVITCLENSVFLSRPQNNKVRGKVHLRTGH
jgi:hypothetical protein